MYMNVGLYTVGYIMNDECFGMNDLIMKYLEHA